MMDALNPLTKTVTVMKPLGLHARTAAKIAKIAGPAQSNVWVIKDKEHVDGKSIIDILTLGCSKGTRIKLKVDSVFDLEILNKIARYIEEEFEDNS